jgi:hypothetical protein
LSAFQKTKTECFANSATIAATLGKILATKADQAVTKTQSVANSSFKGISVKEILRLHSTETPSFRLAEAHKVFLKFAKANETTTHALRPYIA